MQSSRKELKKFFFSRMFWIPISIIIFLEIFLRLGFYKNLLKPLSYSANIIRIKRIIKNSSITPNILIVGTSVPYQGILLDQLNQMAKIDNNTFQSIATQAAYLDTQTMLLEFAIKNQKHIQTIIHFADMDFPWQQRYEIEIANRSMLAQFSIPSVIHLLHNNQYHLRIEDYRFFYIKILTYQSDLRDFFLNPYQRFKSLARAKKRWNPDYPYINQNHYAISSYGHTIEECIHNASHGIPWFINGKQITDEPHRSAVLTTCKMASYDPSYEPGQSNWEELFFIRLKHLYQVALKRKIQIITILPPYSRFMKFARANSKAQFWKKTVHKIQKNIPVIDLRFVLDDENNLDYFYDTIHLNRKGAEKFTKIFYQKLLSFL